MIIRVQSCSNTGSGATVVATFGSPVTAGNWIGVKVAGTPVGGAVRSETMTDTGSNAYALDASQVTGGPGHVSGEVWSGQAVTGGPSFAVTYQQPAGGSLAIEAIEYSVATGAVLSLTTTAAANAASGTALSSGNMTTSGNCLVIGLGVAQTTGQTWTVGSGFTTGLSTAGSGSAVACFCEDQLNVAAGTLAATMADSVSGKWACIGAAYRETFNVMAATEGHDAFAGSGHFSDIGSIAVTAGSDTGSFAGGFKSPATMAKTEVHDTFAGNAKFDAPATMAKTEAHDAMAASGAFATSATVAATEGHDVMVGHATGPSASLAAIEGHDVFAGTGLMIGGATMAATERHDAMAAWGNIFPKLLAIEHGDVFAGSATATGPVGAMAVTAGSDMMIATAGFTYDTHASLHVTEHGDVGAFVGTESSTSTMAPHEHGDVMVAHGAMVFAATMAATEGGDIFRGGLERVIYSVYANTGHGDPINYASAIDVTPTLTYTTAPLSYPGTWSFDCRAKWAISGLEEQNVDARVDIVLDALGRDITNTPPAPLGLRAFATANASVRAEWTSPPTTVAKTPTSFNVYRGIGTPSYGSPIANVLYITGLANSFVANLTTGFTDGVTYAIAVRAANATGEEKNTAFVLVTADSTGPAAVVDLTATATI